jgi:hypothetical protein
LNKDLVIFVLACVAGCALRVGVATRGHNFDMQSWTMTAQIVVEQKNVYAHTYRHPYGPPWFLALGGLRWTHDALGLERLGGESFHIVIAAFLSLADVAIAWLLLRWFGLVAGLYFVLNPVSILLTGYHSQIDNLALLPALGAWLILLGRNGAPFARVPWARVVLSAALLGLSLATKHVMIFFPIWILVCPHVIGGISRRAVHVVLTYATCTAIFVPFLFALNAWAGVREYVLGYEGLANRTLLLHAIDLFLPPAALDSLFGLLPAIVLRRLFIVLMLVFGWFVARRRAGEMFYLYLLAMVTFTYSMADQYLAIPLIACAVYWRRWPAWVYVVPAALLVWWASAEAGALPQPQARWHAYASALSYQHAQVWIAILLLVVLLRPRPHSLSPEGRGLG